MTDYQFMSVAERVEKGLLDAPDGWEMYPAPQQPMKVARQILQECFLTPDEKKLLVYWRNDFWHFNGRNFTLYPNDLGVRKPIYERLEECVYLSSGKEPRLLPWPADRAKISNILEPLAILTSLDDDREAPFRVDDSDRVGNLVCMANGVLNLDTGKLEDHDPGLFTTWSLPFAFDAEATCPRWDTFLTEVLGHDPAAQKTLQQFAGVLVTGDTTRHKMLALIGARRAGKGVTSFVLQQLVGKENVATTTLRDLANDFGLWPLIGKTATFLEDARGDVKVNELATERLLNIVANDTVSVNRKHGSYWNGRLGTRVVLVSNEVPDLPDESMAINSRFLSIKFVKSFTPAEQDPLLKDKLAAELPGIFNWALAGYRDLCEQGTFTEAETAATVDATLSEQSSPMRAFGEDCTHFEITGNSDDYIEVSRVRVLYNVWAEEAGQPEFPRAKLVKKFTAAFPDVDFDFPYIADDKTRYKTKPKDIKTSRKRIFTGVKPISSAGSQWSFVA